MDESDELIKRLERRIEQSGSSAEKQALMEKLNQLKAQYMGYVKDMDVEKEAKAPALPREPQNKPVDIASETQKMGIDAKKTLEKSQESLTSSYRPSSSLNNPKTMSASQRQLLAGEEILAHRQALAENGGVEPNTNKLTKWSQIQKQHIKEAQEYEEEENAHFEAVKQQYKKDIEYQVAPLEFVKSHRVQVLKTRPKSPQIYTDSTFAKIGQADAERKKNAQKEKEELNKMMAE